MIQADLEFAGLQLINGSIGSISGVLYLAAGKMNLDIYRRASARRRYRIIRVTERKGVIFVILNNVSRLLSLY